MNVANPEKRATASQHAEVMNDYIKEGVRQANSLGNRGPIPVSYTHLTLPTKA